MASRVTASRRNQLTKNKTRITLIIFVLTYPPPPNVKEKNLEQKATSRPLDRAESSQLWGSRPALGLSITPISVNWP